MGLFSLVREFIVMIDAGPVCLGESLCLRNGTDIEIDSISRIGSGQ
jgi:hypothetical protein